MVLFYVLLSDIYPFSPDTVFGDIEKSLEIFQSMSSLAVARRCFEITREALSIARKLLEERQHGQAQKSRNIDPATVYNAGMFDHLFDLMPDAIGGVDNDLRGFGDMGGFLNGLVDTNLVFNFLNFED